VVLYLFSVLVNLLIVALIVVGALLLGFLNTLAPRGQEGLVLLTAGRYVYKEVDVDDLLEQAKVFRGFWPAVAQLPQSHPFTVRRLKTLHDAGFFEAPAHDPASGGVVTAES